MNDWGEEDTVNEVLNMVDLDRMARDRGEKLANEWTRRDFYSLLNNHRELRVLDVGELRALFLIPFDIVDTGIYYKRGNVLEVRRRRDRGEKPLYALADAPIDVNESRDAPQYAKEMAILREQEKLDAIWEKI